MLDSDFRIGVFVSLFGLTFFSSYLGVGFNGLEGSRDFDCSNLFSTFLLMGTEVFLGLLFDQIQKSGYSLSGAFVSIVL